MHDTNERARTEQAVADHYARIQPGTRVRDGLRAAGIDHSLHVDALAPIDEFHTRGREATDELLAMLPLTSQHEVLDVGCGIGGSARHLASTRGCRVIGVDLTVAYCELATELSRRVGLGELTSFHPASALDLPFPDASFDVVWTEHAQMNIQDKRTFYAEMTRVLRPGGAMVFHDIFAGNRSGLAFPTPWATREKDSFLCSVTTVHEILAELDLSVEWWRDSTEASAAWFAGINERFMRGGPPPLGVHLLMGGDAAIKIANAASGLASGATVTIQAVLRKQS